MSLTTFSSFYYGYGVSDTNIYLNFDEGGGELTAQVEVGSHTLSTLPSKIKTAMDAVGGQAYTVTADRNTRAFTISATSNFSLLISSGSQAGTSVFSTIGFTGADLSGTNTYTGDATGSEYKPQFILQSHVSTDNFRQAVDGVVNKSADGTIEVVKFGVEKFVEFDIKFITDLPGDGNVIKNNPSGVSDAQAFIQFLITKAPVEYMPDISTKSTFQQLILESTPESRDGLGYKLKEQYSRGLPNYYETGVLKFRLVE